MTNTAIILAAGLGTRMKSQHPKAAHQIAGRAMLSHLIASCQGLFDRLVVVVGPNMAELESLAAPHLCVVQQDRLGTAHAALQAADWFGEGRVSVLYADNPLITRETLQRLQARADQGDAALVLLAMRPPEPGKYGRVVTQGAYVERIVEWADATETERAIGLCNAGVLSAPADKFRTWLQAVRADNTKGEYYLTDVVEIARADGALVAAIEAPFDELRGINSRAELAAAEAVLQSRLRRTAMEGGATLVAPETVFFAADTVLAPDVVVEPNVVFGPGVRVESGARIRAFSHLEGACVGPNAVVGPYARLRPGTSLGEGAHVGNFVELKATSLGAGAKANHLTYLGDASVGAGTNIGAGTITCNYDGFTKSRTDIGEGCFIGSDSVLVAPVRVGDGAFIAAGSVITQDVSKDAMAFGRARQQEIAGRAATYRAARKKE
jgi:bifunctional UDP-N-acetylglucosamine pyrophosphorylase/glucosamine-1-phosphate N-acetyltransferase